MDYADRIKLLREDGELSQSTVAKHLCVAQKTYSDYELRKTRIPLDSIIILAKFYNVDMNYISGTSSIKRTFPLK